MANEGSSLEAGRSTVDAVFQVLDVSRALLSVSQMTEKGWSVQFNKCEAQASIGALKLRFKKRSGMFGIECRSRINKKTTESTTQWVLALEEGATEEAAGLSR